MNEIWSKEVFSKNLKYYLERSNRTQKELAEMLGVSKSTFSRYVAGEIYPRVDKIQKIADYFGILKSDLIENKQDIKEKENNAVADVVIKLKTNETYALIINELNKCNDKQLNQLLTVIQVFNQNLEN